MVQGANPGGQLRAGLYARSPSSLGCKQIPILEEKLIFQLILWLHIEMREICKVLQEMDALEGRVVENRDGQCWRLHLCPHSKQLRFSTAAFGNLTLLPGFF